MVERLADDAPARRSVRTRRVSSGDEIGRRHVVPLLRRVAGGLAGERPTADADRPDQAAASILG